MSRNFFPLLLLMLGFILIGECYEARGENIAVIGPGSSFGTASPPPIYNSPKTIVITRNPANYMTPAVTISKFTPTTDTPPKNDNLSSLGTSNPTMVFTMTSDVKGMGGFAVRSKLEGPDDEDYKAYQSVSARYGNLTQSRKRNSLLKN